ncbi:hypothetical protein [Roseibium album]|uniref:hypothetical protein n=1 Tax=Roseibium album TaxID=311410 RepID=UPI00391CB52A
MTAEWDKAAVYISSQLDHVSKMDDDWLPLDYEKAPNVFSQSEKYAIAEFLELAGVAADATGEDTWSVEWFDNSEEWMRLSKTAKRAFVTFSERGRFSEDREEDLLT